MLYIMYYTLSVIYIQRGLLPAIGGTSQRSLLCSTSIDMNLGLALDVPLAMTPLEIHWGCDVVEMSTPIYNMGRVCLSRGW